MTISLKLISWEQIANNLFKVVVERQQSTDVPTPGNFQEGIDAVLGFGFKVRDNISEITSGTGRIYNRLILQVVPDEVPTDDTESIANFGKISAKVYRDKGDNSLWTVVKSDDGTEKLVRSDTIDGEELLRNKTLEAAEDEVVDLLEPEVYAGDYASFVNANGEVEEGFVVNEDDNSAQYAIDSKLNKIEIESSSQYLDVIPSTHKIFANVDFNEAEDVLKQIKQIYGNIDIMGDISKYMSKNSQLSKSEAEALVGITRMNAATASFFTIDKNDHGISKSVLDRNNEAATKVFDVSIKLDGNGDLMVIGQKNNLKKAVNHLMGDNSYFDKNSQNLVASNESWLQDIDTEGEVEEGTYTGNADSIVKSLLAQSDDATQAIRRINFFVNKQGSNLTNAEEIKKAKEILQNSEIKGTK